MSKKQNKKLLTGEILKQAFIGSVKKLDPRYMIKNPVMFVVETGFFITLLLTIMPGLFGEGDTGLRTYNLIVSIILLITVLFANFCRICSGGPGQSPGRQPEKDPEGHPGSPAASGRQRDPDFLQRAEKGRHRDGIGRRGHSRRRRGHRGYCLGG